MRIKVSLIVLFVTAAMAMSLLPIGIGHVSSAMPMLEELQAPRASTTGSFAYVSEFTSGGNYNSYGWNLISGKSPRIAVNGGYFGEPYLNMKQEAYLISTENVTPGDQFVSFQFAANSQSGTPVFSIINGNGKSVAAVEISGNTVYAGANPESLQQYGTIPSGGVYSNGWAYITANVMNTTSTHSKTVSWSMQLFVDGSSKIFANVSVPHAYQYIGLMIGSVSGSAEITNIVFSSYEIPIYIPGYNPMEGYGQGSGLLVNLLSPFTVLHANMVINNWNVPEVGILSYQINAMNYYGTTTSSCVGFFQLGIDLNPNGTISPWYVPGVNCFAHYFLNSMNPAVQPGFKTPNGSILTLNIIDQPANKTMLFQIIDQSVSTASGDRYWNATIAYNGTEFYGTYTQLEFQPSSAYPISDYYFNGSLYNMGYGNSLADLTPLNNSYMLPFVLDAPPTWSLTYYGSNTAGYNQIG